MITAINGLLSGWGCNPVLPDQEILISPSVLHCSRKTERFLRSGYKHFPFFQFYVKYAKLLLLSTKTEDLFLILNFFP